MAIKVIEQRTCDWCGGDDQDDLRTHRLVFDKRAVEIELHGGCIEEANVPYLLDHGRKATAEDIMAANQIKCPVSGCGKKSTGLMGLAQHIARGHPDVTPDERQTIIAGIKEAQSK